MGLFSGHHIVGTGIIRSYNTFTCRTVQLAELLVQYRPPRWVLLIKNRKFGLKIVYIDVRKNGKGMAKILLIFHMFCSIILQSERALLKPFRQRF